MKVVFKTQTKDNFTRTTFILSLINSMTVPLFVVILAKDKKLFLWHFDVVTLFLLQVILVCFYTLAATAGKRVCVSQ